MSLCGLMGPYRSLWVLVVLVFLFFFVFFLSRLTCSKENAKMSIHILPSCKYCNYIYMHIQYIPAFNKHYLCSLLFI